MIRHGQTEANAARLMAGSLDSPLTALGREQAYLAARAVEGLHIKPAAIIHSQLSRARDTAMIINENLNLPLIEDPDFAELHAGDWEGAPYEECHSLLDGWVDPPGGETIDDFFSRIRRGKNRYFTEFKVPVLIVCHGGVFRAFGKMHGIDNEGVRNCHLYEFEPAPHMKNFPWMAWQHDILDSGKIDRRPAIAYHGDISEIAL